MADTFAVVTGGGTAGHVLPALAIAEALVDAGHDPSEVHYVGARRGIETRLLPPTPFAHSFLDVSGLQRRFDRSGIVANVVMVPKMARALVQARSLLRRLRPRVVVSVGGYASVPATLAARLARIPVVVVSYDRSPGLASRLAARFAAASAVAFPDSPLPRATVTGAPVRRAVRQIDRVRDRVAARHALGLPADRFVVAVTGGSQGSGILNETVAAYVTEHTGDLGLAVRQIVGERFLATAGAGADGGAGVLHQIIGYDDRLELTYAAADVLVGRGGASTVAEVAVTGTPAVLVPWSGAAEDHQTRNVAWLADDGAAIALAERDIGRLGTVLEELRADEPARRRLGERAAAAGAINRSGRLAELIASVAAPADP
jgi:UDP-N-acetylglucosamine--N-acetylmuramyl-(pentapeptide) pyrophosphoryl-undecaprenol N-acetylglucosamine transferase